MSDVLCVWSFPPLLHTHLFSATVFIRLMILCPACLSYKLLYKHHCHNNEPFLELCDTQF